MSANITAAGASALSAQGATVAAGNVTIAGAGNLSAHGEVVATASTVSSGASSISGAVSLTIVSTLLWEDIAPSGKDYADTNLASNSYSDVNLTDNLWEAA